MKEDLKHIFMHVQAPAFWLITMLSLIHIIVRVLKVCLTLMQNRSAFLISLTIFARLKNMKYGAINLLVSTITGNSIRINADNEIFMLKPSENILSLNDFSVISAKSIINRSEPISAVNYKKEFSYLYDCHTYSQLAEKLGFSRQRYVNLAALPSWQRNYKISKMLKDSFKDYKRLEITLKGYVESELLQRFDYSGKLGDFNDYLLFEKVYSIDENAEQTKLILRKNIDISEVNYVD